MESAKVEVALRCAKAAMLLSKLRNCCPTSTESTPEDGEEVRELKKELATEKLKKKKIRMCSIAELLLLIVVLLSFLTLSLFIAFGICRYRFVIVLSIRLMILIWMIGSVEFRLRK